MTYNVLMGTLNPTLSLTHLPMYRVADRPYLDLQRTSSDMSVDADEPVELICNATARPPATIEWTRLGGALLPIGQEKKQVTVISF